MKLAIISHTEHYKSSEGTIVGWSPTVNEINHLSHYFESVAHVAMFHSVKAPLSVMPYAQANIHFVKLPTLGGRSIWSKVWLILNIPLVLYRVHKVLKQVDVFQLRTPTGIAIFLIPYVTLFSKKKGWYKYAGNWNQKHPPFGYRLQRWLLKKQSRCVTINGRWKNQPSHCLTFENPCLTDEDIRDGKSVRSQKTLGRKISFCYVGRLETPKGVGRIIEAFNNLNDQSKARVDEVHFVGDGIERHHFESIAESSDINFVFHGFLDRDAVFNIYKKSHIFLMPTTASEGFPKVIAEAANFGCIPVVSGVSAIAQYIVHNENGFIIRPISSQGLLEQLRAIFEMDDKTFSEFLKKNEDFVKRFTFEYYISKIRNEILN